MKHLMIYIVFAITTIVIYGEKIPIDTSFFNNNIENMEQTTFVLQDKDSFKWKTESGDYTIIKEGSFYYTKDDFGDIISLNYEETTYDYGETTKSYGELNLYYVFQNDILILYHHENIIAVLSSTDSHLIKESDGQASTSLIEILSGNKVFYIPENLRYTSSLKEFWAEADENDGVGQKLSFDIYDIDSGKGNATNVRSIVIFNGVFYDDALHYSNNRAKKLKIQSDNKIATEITIKDIRKPQVFKLNNWNELKKITITIQSVYKGSKWNDLCINKIIFLGE